jgi:hypothetical protein
MVRPGWHGMVRQAAYVASTKRMPEVLPAPFTGRNTRPVSGSPSGSSPPKRGTDQQITDRLCRE